MIQHTDKKILDALSHALRGDVVGWAHEMDDTALAQMFAVCERHGVTALVADALPEEVFWRGQTPFTSAYVPIVRGEILKQAARTAELCLLFRNLRLKGLHPIVMKGVVCRSLYPEPEHRPSVDEDLLIMPAEFRQLHEVLLSCGMVQVKPEEDPMELFEVSYRDPERDLYLEVHKTPFMPNAPFLDRLNDCFLGVHNRTVVQDIYGTEYLTMAPEDHLLYLLLHALKHFLFSGFGIRQICDVAVFSEHYRTQIDWADLKNRLTEIEELDFVRAVYRIALEVLLPDSPLAGDLADWDVFGIDAEPLLDDIMEGGLYGSATMSRVHSSNMTLRAASKQDAQGLNAVLYSLYPPLESMRSKYPYLKKLPVLLPVAWMQRHVNYLWELVRHRGRANSALTSIRVGSERIRLLEMYNIIKR